MNHYIVKTFNRFYHANRYETFSKMIDYQKMSADQVKEMQGKKLKRLLKHAYKTVGYYRNCFDSLGLSEDIISGTVDFSTLPILEREDLRTYRDSLLSSKSDQDSLIFCQTGGSTGNPVSFYYDKSAYNQMMAAQYRLFTWSGWDLGEKIINFWGAQQDLAASSKFRKLLGDVLSGTETIAAYDFDTQILDGWLTRLNRVKPSILYGYPSVLAALGRHIIDTGRAVVKLKGIFSTAEVLYQDQRDIIEAAFDCKVFNQYGCREIPSIASECRFGNMHIFSDMAYVESVSRDEDDAGEKLIVTSLSNWSMPLVRYELGDYGKLKEGRCDCGSPFPMMEMGMCKSNDVFILPHGKRVHPSYFNSLLQGVSGLSQYQFRQVEVDEVILFVTESDSKNIEMSELTSLQSRIQSDLGADLKFRVNVVESIPRTMSGKFRYIVSDIKAERDHH